MTCRGAKINSAPACPSGTGVREDPGDLGAWALAWGPWILGKGSWSRILTWFMIKDHVC